MRGNPTAHLLVSAAMTGVLTKRPDLKHVFDILKRNNMPDGIIGMPPQVTPEDISFYIKNGYVAGNAGITMDLAFQDWAVAQLACKIGKKKDYRYFIPFPRVA